MCLKDVASAFVLIFIYYKCCCDVFFGMEIDYEIWRCMFCVIINGTRVMGKSRVKVFNVI